MFISVDSVDRETLETPLVRPPDVGGGGHDCGHLPPLLLADSSPMSISNWIVSCSGEDDDEDVAAAAAAAAEVVKHPLAASVDDGPTCFTVILVAVAKF
jgi:hypothetical protein